MGIDVVTYAERRKDGKWEPISESDTYSFDCHENTRMLARFLGNSAVEEQLIPGLPVDLSPQLRSALSLALFVSWISGVELKNWHQKRIGRRKYSAYIYGFVHRAIPSLLAKSAAEDVRVIFEFSP